MDRGNDSGLIGRLLPWVAVLLALPLALGGIAVTAPTACDELQGAFVGAVTTETSNVLDGFVADKCETTDILTGATESATVVNWSGLIAAVALLAMAWFAGAGMGGRLELRKAAAATGAAALILFGAVFAFFV